MANKRPKPEQIVSKLRQIEVPMGQGMSCLEVVPPFQTVLQRYSGVSGLGFMPIVAFSSLPSMRCPV